MIATYLAEDPPEVTRERVSLRRVVWLVLVVVLLYGAVMVVGLVGYRMGEHHQRVVDRSTCATLPCHL